MDPAQSSGADAAACSSNNESGNPPQLSVDLLSMSDIRTTTKEPQLPVDIVLLTVKEYEFLACYQQLKDPYRWWFDNIGYVYFEGVDHGQEEKVNVALLKCYSGSAGPGGALITVKKAVTVLKPKAVISVGTCSGLDPEKTRLGDVVVSAKLATYASKEVTSNKEQSTGMRSCASKRFLDVIKNCSDGWQAPLKSTEFREVKVHCGEFLSGPEIVSAKWRRKQLVEFHPQAVALEMEGEGVFTAAFDSQIEWLMVKGIADFADGTQLVADSWSSCASVIAASLVKHILINPVIFRCWPHYNEPCSVDSFDVQTCRCKLADYYKNSGTVPTSVWSALDPVDIHQIYTHLSWVKQEQKADGPSELHLRHYCDLFSANEDGILPKRILVQGQTGIGKTTFVKKLAVDWAELDDKRTGFFQNAALKKFELLVAVNLKEVSKYQSLRDVITFSNVFSEEDKSLIDGLISHITNNQDKVLLVFDGYDEYRCGRDSEIYKIFKGEKLRNCCVLITTRISKADDLRESKVLKVLRAEITGFRDDSALTFLNRKLGSETEAQDLCDHLCQKGVIGLLKVPLLLSFFCTLWKEMKEGRLKSWPETKTNLYEQIVETILYHNQAKHAASVDCCDLNDFKELLCEIGKVALDSLLNDDHVFEYSRLPPSISCEESCFIGLLQVTKYIGSRRPTGLVSFIHKSIQEFLAAWYITYKCVILDSNLGLIEEHTRTLEDCLAFENVFQFVCGLTGEGAVKVLVHMENVRKSDSTLHLSPLDVKDVTVGQCAFNDLVLDCFQNIQSKDELSSKCFDCLGGVILVKETRTELPKLKDLNWSFRALSSPDCFFSDMNSAVKALRNILECLKNHCSELVQVCDFVNRFLSAGCNFQRIRSDKPLHVCTFSSLLCFRSGKVQFFITDLVLLCNNHAKEFIEAVETLALHSELLSLNFLTFIQVCYSLDKFIAQKYLATIRNCKSLKSIALCTEKKESCQEDDCLCDLLKEIPNPKTCSLRIGNFYDELAVSPSILIRFFTCHPTSAEAKRLSDILPSFENIINLRLDLRHCLPAVVEILVSRVALDHVRHLELKGIKLTPAVCGALGQSLPHLLSLDSLKLSGLKGQQRSKTPVHFADLKALFGGFCKPVSLKKLCLKDFNLGSKCGIAPLYIALQFMPELFCLKLRRLYLNGTDLCTLLESFVRHNLNLWYLDLRGNSAVDAVVTHISRLPKLSSLCIDKNGFSMEGWKSLVELVQAHGLCTQWTGFFYP